MEKFKFHILGILSLFILVSCDYFQPTESAVHIARVNDNYLTKSELDQAMPKNLVDEDSVIFAHNYINRWATRQLLLDGARLNLPQEKLEEYDAMVKDYQEELYAEAYKDLLVIEKMDTTITDREIEAYFENNSSNFTLKEDLIKLRYVQLAKDYGETDEIIEQFKRYNEEDKADLEEDSFKFEAYSLMDSIWVSADELLNRLDILEDEDEEDFLKKDTYFERSDSLSLYLLYIKDVRLRNEEAPLSYAKPTVKQIILNKRKLQFAKELEKDITKDALENDKFEIYK